MFTIIYITPTILLILMLASSLATYHRQSIINGFKRIINKCKRPSIQQIVKDEVEKQIKQILND